MNLFVRSLLEALLEEQLIIDRNVNLLKRSNNISCILTN